jgi:hypothetical protein
MGWLTGTLVKVAPPGQTVAYAGAIMASVYALAFLVLPFLPETKGIDIDRE